MINLTVQTKRLGPIRGHHPWVFSGALKYIPEDLASGTPVGLVDERGNFLAQGYFNSYSQMAVRIWSWEQEKIDEAFFVKRILAANKIRQNYLESKATDSYRLINSENDLLPGLIVDKYQNYLCLQFHTVGIGKWKNEIVEALKKVVKPKGIYERSDVRDRRRDALEKLNSTGVGIVSDDKKVDEGTGVLWGEVPEKIKIKENNLKYYVDVLGGQKTGFFLDQRDKREALKKYVKDKNVLNCFSYTGGFTLSALVGGAKRVVSVDVSESALSLAKENVELNKFDLKKCEFIKSDVKGYLDLLCDGLISTGGQKFDVIILDPPAFIKDRKKIREGIMGYKKINEMAMRLLPPGGILVTASCSAHLSLQDFRYMLSESAGHTGKTLQILETYTHGIDHPELVAFTEGEYLKCVFGVIS